MKFVPFHTLIIALFASATVWAAPGGDSPAAASAPADPALEKARSAISAKEWSRAQEAAKEGLARDPQNAEYHNLYAYSLRMGANPSMDLVFRHYNEALRLSPRHRGAHEYIGEAYLMSGNLSKAKEHLGQLDKICTFGCDEYSKLKKAVAEFEQKQAKR